MDDLKKYIDMYKKFMVLETFPNVCVEYYNEYDLLNAVAVVNNDDILNDIFVLRCHEDINNYLDRYITATVFHEFTHILDGLVFRQMDYDIFLNLMSTYSEFHSSRIEFMYLYGCCRFRQS